MKEKDFENQWMKRDECVSLITAKLLKEKGFDWKVEGYYGGHNITISRDIHYTNSTYPKLDSFRNEPIICSAPSQSIAQKWLRDEHGIVVLVTYGMVWSFEIWGDVRRSDSGKYQDRFGNTYWYDSYENALEGGIKKALEMI